MLFFFIYLFVRQTPKVVVIVKGLVIARPSFH